MRRAFHGGKGDRTAAAVVHVLLVHQPFAAPREVGSTRHYELARHLTQAGHHVTVLTSNVSHATGAVNPSHHGLVTVEETSDGVSIWRCATYKTIHRSIAHRLISYFSFTVTALLAGLRVKHVDVVWGSSPQPIQGLTAWALARIKRVPFLFEVRDLWPDTVIQLGYLRCAPVIALWRWVERFLYRSADFIIVNSPAFVPYLHGCGVAESCVAVVTNGVETADFHPAERGEGFRQEYGLDGRFVVMYAGVHGLTTDLDSLLQAAERLRSIPDMTFVLVGHGINKANLVRMAHEHGLDNVVFIPPQPKTRMSEVLAAADVCVAILKPVPVFATVYPNKVFDYMAAGRPTVLAIDGAIRQVMEEANGGLCTPPGNPEALASAILRLYGDEEMRRRLGENARTYVVTRFDRRIQAAELERVVQRVAAMARCRDGRPAAAIAADERAPGIL